MIWISRDRLLVSVLTSSSHHAQLLMAWRIMNYLPHLNKMVKHVSAGTISIHIYPYYLQYSYSLNAGLHRLLGRLPASKGLRPCLGTSQHLTATAVRPTMAAGWPGHWSMPARRRSENIETGHDIYDMTWLHRLLMIVFMILWSFECTWDMQFRSSIETSELYEA